MNDQFEIQQNRNAEARKHKKKYTEKDLVDFGNALLERRAKELTLQQVTHADIENFKTSQV